MAVIALPDPGRGAGQVADGTLQHLPGRLHHGQGRLHSLLSHPRFLSCLSGPWSTAASSLLQNFEESLERPREISPQSH